MEGQKVGEEKGWITPPPIPRFAIGIMCLSCHAYAFHMRRAVINYTYNVVKSGPGAKEAGVDRESNCRSECERPWRRRAAPFGECNCDMCDFRSPGANFFAEDVCEFDHDTHQSSVVPLPRRLHQFQAPSPFYSRSIRTT